MKNSRITFIGTPSHKSARNISAGQCFRTVNLRYHNGSLVPVGNVPIAVSLSSPERIVCYTHYCNESEHIISRVGRTIYHDLDKDNTGYTTVNRELLTLDDTLSSVQSVGNTLILVTATSVHYLLHGAEGYKVLGTQPPMPLIRFHSVKEEDVGTMVGELSMHGKMASLSDEAYTTFYNHLMSSYYKLREEVYDNHNFLQPTIIRYALRLYDGSHILPSAPILLGNVNKPTYDEERTTIFQYREYNEETVFSAFPMTFTPYSIHYTVDSMMLDEWRDIVMGIDVFVSKEIPLLTDKDDNTSHSVAQGNDTYILTFKLPSVDNKSLTEMIERESMFYKLYSIDTNNANVGEQCKITHDIHPNDLIYKSKLTVDNSSFNRMGAKQTCVYNNRLHLADITYRYYEGYPLQLFAHGYDTDSDSATAYTRTTIKLSNGEMRQVTATATIPHFDYLLSPLISYPHIHATSMLIVIRHRGWEYRHTFSLRSCDNENRSGYVHTGIGDIDVTAWERTAITADNENDFATASSGISVQLHNHLVVSRENNPFSFPTEHTYAVSEGTIVGIAAATTALSQGQLGEFPLYLFTTHGIWSMQQGDEVSCYTRCIPINNECVDDTLPITPVEHAIVYKSGNNICSISGSRSSVLLPLTENRQEETEYRLDSIFPHGKAVLTDSGNLMDFFKGYTAVGYIHTRSEMIFINHTHDYCMVLHLPSGHLYRRDSVFRHVTKSQGTLLAQGNNNALYDLYNENETFTEVGLITHPIQPAPDTYTRLRQVMWRMKGDYLSIESIITTSHEPDSNNIVTHRMTYSGNMAGHLPIRHMASPYKYYRLMLSGVVTPDFRIDCADISYDIVKNSKLR